MDGRGVEVKLQTIGKQVCVLDRLHTYNLSLQPQLGGLVVS
jgi:hypothetical protein